MLLLQVSSRPSIELMVTVAGVCQARQAKGEMKQWWSKPIGVQTAGIPNICACIDNAGPLGTKLTELRESNR